MEPMVSVVIPTYKRSEMLPRAIKSVLTQTYENVQVVVVDDNNPESEYRVRTAEIMHQFDDDPRVKFVLHKKNMNGSVARNTGIENADGEIVAFLDDDDFFYPEKVEKQTAYLLQHPQFHAVYCGWDRAEKTVIPYDEGNLSYNILSGDHIIMTNAIMMWKEDALIPVVSHDIFTNGIAYVKYYFSLNHVSEELLPYVSLLTALYKEVDTQRYSYGELANEIDLLTGGIGVGLGTVMSNKTEQGYEVGLFVSTKVLYENLAQALSLMEEILFTSKVTDAKRMKEVLAEIVSQMKVGIPESGHTAMATRALSYLSKGARVKEVLEGISFYEFVSDLYLRFDAKYEDICDKLHKALHALAKPQNLTVSYTGQEDVTKVLQAALKKLQLQLNTDEADYVKQQISLCAENEGFKTASKVQYVAQAGNFKKQGYAYTGALQVLQVIFSYDYLWIRVRVKGGAYGCMCSFNRNGDSYFTSYRDPNLDKTYAVYQQAPEYVRTFEASDRDMVKYIIGAISKLDTPMTPSTEGAYAFQCYLAGVTDEDLQRNRDEVLGADVEHIRQLAPYIEAVLQEDCIAALGNEALIEENKDRFRHIKNLI